MGYKYITDTDSIIEARYYTDDPVDGITVFASAEPSELWDRFGNPLYKLVDGVIQSSGLVAGIAQLNEEIACIRKSEYISEADELFMKYQRKLTEESKQVWLDKVAEIKAAHPYHTG